MFKIRKKNLSKVLVKYILSYLILLLIPLLIISLLLYGYFCGIIKEGILSEYKTTLEYTLNITDNSFLRLKNIAMNINTNSKLSKYAISDSISNQMESIKVLNSYSFQNELISKIALYYKDMPLIYTNSGTQFPETFEKSSLHQNFEDQSFRELLKSINTPALFCTSSLNKFQILYIIPLPVESLSPKGWVLYILSESKIKDPIIQMIKMIKKYNSVTLVLDSKNCIISQIGGEIDTSSVNVDLLLSGNLANENIIEIKGEKFLYQYASSDLGFLSYLNFIPYDIAMSKLNSFKYYFSFGVMGFFVLGFLLIVALGNKHYKPIKGLKDFTTTLLGELTEQQNDFEIIRNTIKTLHDRDMAMRSILSYNSRALRAYILKKLLMGNFTSRDELNKDAASIDLHFDYNVFRVIIFSLERQFQSTSVPNNEIIGFVESYFTSEYNIYGTDTLANNNLIFILSHHSLSLEILKNSIREIIFNIERQFNTNVSVGIGGLYNNTTEIPRSYMEALIAVDSCFVGSLYPMCYEEINLLDNYNKINRSINKDLYDLQRFLRQGDSGKVISSLNKIQKKIVNKDSSILIIRHFCYSIYYSIMQTISNQDNILSMIAKDYMEALVFCNTADHFFELLRKLCIEICIEFSAQLESQNLELCDNAIKYIDEFYMNADFSVQIMAEDLKVSPSYLSRYFKDQTGKTITDYLIYKRIEKAKILLCSTDEPIRKIIQHIGYQNETSFIRTFKKVEGITPGMYRSRMLV